MTVWIALIRGIGAKTHKVMPLKSLAESFRQAGLEDVVSIRATGNFVFRTELEERHIAALLQDAIEEFGIDNPVFLRTPDEVEEVLEHNPFPDSTANRPNHVLVSFVADPLSEQAVENLDSWDGPEWVHCGTREFYLFFEQGIGGSKLSPAKIERLAGQRTTARNWSTLTKVLQVAQTEFG